MVTVVYIAPNANANSALSQLYNAISLQQNTHPEAVHLIAGDFNHADLKVVLPKFHQHINCATRGGNTLDKAYSNIKHGYKTKQLPHLGSSDHMSLLLITAYTTIKKKAVKKPLKPCLMMPHSSCRTVLEIPTGPFSKIRTWKSTPPPYSATSSIVLTLSLWTGASGCIKTKNPG